MSAEYQEYPEPPRYKNEPGWVKANPLNNASYLRKACELYPEWSDEFRYADEQIEALVPGYNIDQIKEKFGGPRFYISFPEGVQVDEGSKKKALDIAFRVGSLLDRK